MAPHDFDRALAELDSSVARIAFLIVGDDATARDVTQEASSPPRPAPAPSWKDLFTHR